MLQYIKQQRGCQVLEALKAYNPIFAKLTGAKRATKRGYTFKDIRELVAKQYGAQPAGGDQAGAQMLQPDFTYVFMRMVLHTFVCRPFSAILCRSVAHIF